MAQEIHVYERSLTQAPLRQCEILSNLIQLPLDSDNISYDAPVVESVLHPYAIVISQDCDLDWDFKARQDSTQEDYHKLLPNVLFCVVTTAEELRGRADINSSIWKNIRLNKNERYHFLQRVKPIEDALEEGLPELSIDFKRYFTVPTNEVYFQIEKSISKRRCRLRSPYLEHLNSRFAYFQSRVALPEDHFSEPSNPP